MGLSISGEPSEAGDVGQKKRDVLQRFQEAMSLGRELLALGWKGARQRLAADGHQMEVRSRLQARI